MGDFVELEGWCLMGDWDGRWAALKACTGLVYDIINGLTLPVHSTLLFLLDESCQPAFFMCIGIVAGTMTSFAILVTTWPSYIMTK